MSSFSIGQMNQFGDAFEAVGGNTKHLTCLGQSPVILENLLKVLDGQAVFQLSEAPAPVLFSFEKNEHGHVILTFTGLDLVGVEEIGRLESANYRVGDYAKSCFRSMKKDGYDKKHRLVAGQEYKVALMPGREIEHDRDRTTDALRRRGMNHYGYGEPLAGLIPRVRETLSDKQMEELDIWYVAALHDPITDSDGSPDVLDSRRRDGGRQVDASWDDPDDQWDDCGAFVFPVSAR